MLTSCVSTAVRSPLGDTRISTSRPLVGQRRLVYFAFPVGDGILE